MYIRVCLFFINFNFNVVNLLNKNLVFISIILFHYIFFYYYYHYLHLFLYYAEKNKIYFCRLNSLVIWNISIISIYENYWKYKFKYSLIKDPIETSSLEYIKQQIKQYLLAQYFYKVFRISSRFKKYTFFSLFLVV